MIQVKEPITTARIQKADGRDVVVSRSNPAASRGESVFRVDLARLNRWVPPRAGPARYATSGRVEGSVRVRGVPEGTQLLLEAKLQGRCGKTRDFREGVLAFVEKRTADFEGR